MRALLSVTDKSGIAEFGKGLADLGYELLSTGGTAKFLREAGLPVIDVASITQFPEMLDGRVKTLHPMVHGALLGDTTNPDHIRQMAEHDIQPIDLLCVNLYAFEQTIAAPHTLEEAVESVDIGGPAMIRAASKNGSNVSVVVDPADYSIVLDAIKTNSIREMRMRLMAKAFRHTAYYDATISRYFSAQFEPELMPEKLTIGLKKAFSMRYGENPHQLAALYHDPLAMRGIASAEQLWGKELSYNNLLDGHAAWELVADMPVGSCAIIKHGNPCGAAVAESLGASYSLARESDPISAFGGIAAFHGVIDESAANAMTAKGNFLEVVIGTDFSPLAIEIFQSRAGWGQNVRLVRAELPTEKTELMVRTIRGGALVQESDEEPINSWSVVTERQPTEDEWEALRLMWCMVKHVKSNAIVVGTKNRLLGTGAGQMNRVQSVRLALDQAGEGSKGAVLCSDAFFPFPDSVITAAEHGIAAIAQPGGSKKDDEVIAEANARGVAMVFTGIRHFQH